MDRASKHSTKIGNRVLLLSTSIPYSAWSLSQSYPAKERNKSREVGKEINLPRLANDMILHGRDTECSTKNSKA